MIPLVAPDDRPTASYTIIPHDANYKTTSAETTHQPFIETDLDKADVSLPDASQAHDSLESSDSDSCGTISVPR